jgi:hypothetical protein
MSQVDVFQVRTVAGRTEIWAARNATGPVLSLPWLMEGAAAKVKAALERAWDRDAAWLAGQPRNVVVTIAGQASRVAGALAGNPRLMQYGVIADGDDVVALSPMPPADMDYARSFVDGFEQAAASPPAVTAPGGPPAVT